MVDTVTFSEKNGLGDAETAGNIGTVTTAD